MDIPCLGRSENLSWTTGTLARTTIQLTDQFERLTKTTSELAMNRDTEKGSLEKIMEMMLQMQTKQNEQFQIREERREQRDAAKEDEREERRVEREDRRDRETRELLAAMKEARPAVPQTVHIVNQKLPDMKEGEDIDTFVALFEAALRANNIPQAQWTAKIHSQLNVSTKLKIQHVLQDEHATYEDIKEALLGCGNMTFSAASETLLTGDKGKVFSLPHRQCRDKLFKLTQKVLTNAVTLKDATEAIVVAIMRQNLNPTLKTYVDLKGMFDIDNFSKTIDEWEASQPTGAACFKKLNPMLVPSAVKPVLSKKSLTCFYCGKLGHISKECRSRLGGEKSTQLAQQLLVPKTEQTDNTPGGNIKPAKREVTCFLCRQKGHKSPQCPQKQAQVSKIQIPVSKVVPLKENQLFGSIGGHRMPITCDSGADITVVPEECVSKEQFTGDLCDIDSYNMVRSKGKLCNITVTIDGKDFLRRAVAQPGKEIDWTACLSLPFSDKQDWSFIFKRMDHKQQMREEDTLYLPPEIKQGILLSGVLVSEGVLINNVNVPVTSMINEVPSECVVPRGSSGNVMDSSVEKHDVADEEDEMGGSSEDVLASGEQPSVLGEAAGEPLGGSTVQGEDQEISMEGIRNDIHKSQSVEKTLSDKTLEPMLKLAKMEKEGYHLENGILFRTRLDPFGQAKEQICLPEDYRHRCLKLAHTNFGHQGRNKMVELIKPFFHWSSLTRDCLTFVKSCDECQRKDKTKPKHNSMQIREMTSIPFERVAVDLVGPFPTAVGGYRFLLTCIDMATRWPEAIPLRTTTARAIIKHLTDIFARCGFPTAIVTDNGSQFTGKVFHKWLKSKGIKHVRASPYHPQGNGMVERLHRTLNSMISKIAETKGNWASVTPMALYFIRSTPSSATGLSPFMARQGWEPVTPIQLLYKSWAQTDLGEIDLSDWVAENAERVESA